MPGESSSATPQPGDDARALRDRGHPLLSIVIAAYNEARVLPATIRRLRALLQPRYPFELIVCDDGSNDGTSVTLEALRADVPELRLLPDPVNRGKGAAIRRGVLATRGRYVLCTDADFVYGLDYLDRYLEAIDRGADLAIGSRGHPESRFILHPRHFPYLNQRHLMGLTYIWALNRLLDLGVSDTQCGFKVYRGSVARDLFARSVLNGFAFDVEVLYLARLYGRVIVELPVRLDYRGEPSSVRLLRSAGPMLLDLFRIRRRLGPLPANGRSRSDLKSAEPSPENPL